MMATEKTEKSKKPTNVEALKARLAAKRKAAAEKVAGVDPKDLPAAAPQPAHSGELKTMMEEFRTELSAKQKDIKDAAKALNQKLKDADTALEGAREELKAKTDELKAKTDELAEAKKALKDRTNELAQAQKDLKDKTQELTATQGKVTEKTDELVNAKTELLKATRARESAERKLADTITQLEAEQKTSQELARRVGVLEDKAADKGVVEDLKTEFEGFMEDTGAELGRLASEQDTLKSMFDDAQELDVAHTKVLNALSVEGENRAELFNVAVELGFDEWVACLEDLTRSKDETAAQFAKAALERRNEVLVAGASLQDDPQSGFEWVFQNIENATDVVRSLTMDSNKKVAEMCTSFVQHIDGAGQ
jgi:chromosome segregation ATPase